ncbi:MAG: tyrosine-type recombinase/integrase [Chthoniobacteraceae bacterium]
MQLASAETKLLEAGVSLEQAIVWALERGTAVREHKSLADLRDEFIAEKERIGCRERTVRQLRVSLGSFVVGRELQLAHETTRAHVEAWLRGGWQAATQKNYLGDLRGMFKWAREKRYVAENPCREVKAAEQRTEREIAVLSPEQVEQLFATAVLHEGRVFDRSSRTYAAAHVFHPLLAYVALATFCGIRPEEIKRSGASSLHLKDRAFVVAGSVAKTGKRRVVDLPTSALAWLQLWRKLCGEESPIIPRNFRKLWERLREAAKLKPLGWNSTRGKKSADCRRVSASTCLRQSHAVADDEGLSEWPHDVLRHTTATMHYRLHENPSWLKAQLGHVEDEDTLHRNYRAVRLLDGRAISKALARKFWAVRPSAPMKAMARR